VFSSTSDKKGWIPAFAGMTVPGFEHNS